jgi:hypothetical protein
MKVEVVVCWLVEMKKYLLCSTKVGIPNTSSCFVACVLSCTFGLGLFNVGSKF